MQVSKRVPFDDPQVLMGVRILYVVSNLIIFGLYYYIGMNIKAKRGTSADAPPDGFRPLTESSRSNDTEIRRTRANGIRRRTEAGDNYHSRV